MKKALGRSARKRMLSMLLAICMTAALLPAQSFAVEEEPGSGIYTYDFRVLSQARRGVENPEAAVEAKIAADYSAVTELSNSLTENGRLDPETDAWSYAGQSEDASFTFTEEADMLFLAGREGGWASIRFRVPCAGNYQLSSVNRFAADQGAVRFYLAEASIASDGDARVQGDLLAEVDTNQENEEQRETVLGEIELTEGDYIMTIELSGNNEISQEQQRFGISQFKLLTLQAPSNVNNDDLALNNLPSGDLVYDMRKGYNTALEEITYEKLAGLNSGIESAPWAYQDFVKGGSNGYVNYGHQEYGLHTYQVGTEVSLKVRVEEAGNYRPVIKFFGMPFVGSNVDASFGKLDGEQLAERKGIYTGSVQGPQNVALSMSALPLEVGEYVFSWKITGAGEGVSDPQTYLRQFVLEREENIADEESEVLYDFRVMGTNTTAEHLQSISYDSVKNTQSQQWGFQSVEKVAGNVNSYAKYNHADKSFGPGISVVNTQLNLKIKVPESGKYAVATNIWAVRDNNQKMQLTLRKLTGDGQIDATAVMDKTIDGSVASGAFTDVDVTGDDLVDLEAGEYVLSAKTVQNDATWYWNWVKLTHADNIAETKKYDFTVAYDAEKDTPEKLADISYAQTEAAGSAPWKIYAGGMPWPTSRFGYGIEDQGLYMADGGVTGMVRLRVEKDGVYSLDMGVTRETGPESAQVQVGLHKRSAGGHIEKTPLLSKLVSITGDVGQEERYTLSDQSIELTKGDYVIDFLTKAKGGFYIGDVTLTAESIEVSAETETIHAEVGTETTVPLTIAMGDGSPVDYSSLTVNTSCEPADIASIIVDKTDNSVSLRVTGEKAGSGTIKAEVVIGELRRAIELPVTVADPNLKENLIYDLRKGTGQTLENITYDMTAGTTVNPKITSAPWAYHRAVLGGDDGLAACGYIDYGIRSKGIGTSVSLKIKVDQAGYYRPVAKLFAYPQVGSTVDIALSKLTADGQAGETLAEKKAVSTWAVQGPQNVAMNLSALWLDAGEYVFSWQIVEKRETVSSPECYVRQFVLEQEENIMDEEQEYLYDFRLMGSMNDTSDTFFKSITYDKMRDSQQTRLWGFHSIENVTDGNHYAKYVVTGGTFGPGIAGQNTQLNLKIKVPESGIYDVSTYFYGPNTNQNKVQMSLYKLNSDGSIGQEAAMDATLDVSAAQNTSVEADLTGEAPVTLDAGEYVLRAQTTSGAATWYLHWLKLTNAEGGTGAQKYDFRTMYDAEKTTPESMTDIRFADTKAAGSAPWKIYGGQLPYDNSRFGYGAANNGLYIADSATTAIVRLRVERAGRYTLDMGATPNSGNMQVQAELHKRSVGGQIENEALTQKLVAITGTAGQEVRYSLNDGTVNLEKGEYVLYLFTKAAGSFYIGDVTLTPSSIEVSSDTEKILVEVDKETTIPLTVTMGDGSPVDYEGLVISASCEPADIATVTGIKTENSASLQVTGVKAGAGTIKAELRIGDASKTIALPVLVADSSAPDQDLLFDLRKGSGQTIEKITYEMTAGQDINPQITSQPWAYYSFTAGDQWGLVDYVVPDFGMRIHRPNTTMSVKLMVTKGGTYLPIAKFFANPGSGGRVDVSLSKLSAPDDPIALRGNVNVGPIQGPLDIALADKPMQLDAGEYVLRWKVIGGGATADHVQCYLRQFELQTEQNAVREAGGYLYDFRSLSYKNDATQDFVKSITYEMNAGLTSAATDEWAFHSLVQNSEGGVNSYFKYNTAGFGIASFYAGTQGNLKLKVPADGAYQVSTRIYPAFTSDKAITLSLHKLTGDAIDENAIVERTINGAARSDEDIVLNDTPVALAAGEYVLSVKTNSTLSGAWYLQNLKLMPAQALSEVNVYDFSVLYDSVGQAQEAAGQITYAKTIEAGSAPWGMYGWYLASGDSAFKYGEENHGLLLAGQNTSAVVRFQVPAQGGYSLDLDMVPAVAESANVHVEIHKLNRDGSIDLYSELSKDITVSGAVGESQRISLNDSALPLIAGDYVMYMKFNSPASCYVSKLLVHPTMTIAADSTMIQAVVGQTALVPLTITLSNGSELDYSQLDISASSIPADLASVIVQKSDEGVKLQVSGEKAGTGELQLTVSYGDVLVSQSFALTVKDGAGGDEKRDLIYDFRKAWSGDSTVNYASTITYAVSGGLNEQIASEPWAYYDFTGPGYMRYVGGIQYAGFQNYMVGSTASLKMNVSVAGSYIPQAVVYGIKRFGMNAEVTLSKLKPDGKLETIAKRSGFHAGAIDGPMPINLSNAPIDLDVGEYVVSWTVLDRDANNSDKQQCYMQQFKFLLDEHVADEARDMEYDFTALYSESDQSQAYAEGITYEKTQIPTDPWAFHSYVPNAAGGGDSFFKYVYVGCGLGLSYVNTEGNIKLKVPHDGTYQISAGIRAPSSCATEAELSLHKLSSDGSIEQDAIASTSVQASASNDQTVPVKLGEQEITLTAGEYVLRARNTSGNDVWYLQNLRLTLMRQCDAQSYDFTALYDADDLTQERTERLSYGMADAAGSLPWASYSWFAQDGHFNYTEQGKGLQLKGTYGSGTVRFRVLEDGDFLPVLNISAPGASQTQVRAEIHKVNAYGGIDQTVLCSKTFSTQGAEDGSVILCSEERVSLPAGDYVLTCSNTSGTDPWNLDSLKLVNKTGLIVASDDAAVKIGESKEITAYVTDADGKTIDLNGAQVSANVFDPTVASLEVASTENNTVILTLSGLKDGETKANIMVIAQDGTAGVTSLTLYVNAKGELIAKDLRYSFHKLSLGAAGEGSNDEGIDVKSVVSLAQTTKGDPQEILPNSTVATDPWCFVSTNAGKLTYNSGSYGLFFGYEPATAAFKIRVPSDGVYRAVSENMKWRSGAYIEIYLAPDGAVDPVAQEYYLGTVDGYSATKQDKTTNALRIVNLTKGEYTLTYRLQGKNPAVTTPGQVGIGAFELQGTSSDALLDIMLSGPSQIKTGEKAQLSAQVVKTEGTAQQPLAADVEISASPEGIVGIEEQAGGDGANHIFNLTGLKAGTTVLTVQATVDNSQIKQTLIVTVTGATASRDYAYMIKGKLNVGDQISKVTSYSMTTAGSPNELRPETKTDPWYYAYHKAAVFYYAADAYGAILGTTIGDYAGIHISLAESGIFRPEIPYYSGNITGIVRMYIAPSDAENPMADEYSVGIWDTYTPKEETNRYRTAIFRPLYLDAGEYIVSWKIDGENEDIADHPRLWFGGVEFKHLEEYPRMNIEADDAPPIAVGNTAKIHWNLTDTTEGRDQYTDAEDLIGATYSAQSSNADVASAKADTGILEITGVKPGQTDITVNGFLPRSRTRAIEGAGYSRREEKARPD